MATIKVLKSISITCRQKYVAVHITIKQSCVKAESKQFLSIPFSPALWQCENIRTFNSNCPASQATIHGSLIYTYRNPVLEDER